MEIDFSLGRSCFFAMKTDGDLKNLFYSFFSNTLSEKDKIRWMHRDLPLKKHLTTDFSQNKFSGRTAGMRVTETFGLSDIVWD